MMWDNISFFVLLYFGGMKMITLIILTMFTSAADSLNPIAIAQQLVYQSFSRKKSDIIFFIVGIGLTNFFAGLLVYYGFANILGNRLKALFIQYPTAIYWIEIVIGISIIAYVIYKLLNKGHDQSINISKPRMVLGPVRLFFLGILACGLELTSALPYFAFLAIMVQYQLTLMWVIIILIIYNLVYSLPLVVIYVCSIFFEKKLSLFNYRFNILIDFITNKLSLIHI